MNEEAKKEMAESKSKRDHFGGLDVDKHILEKFRYGTKLSSEPHGVEPSGALLSFVDSGRISTVFTTLLVLVYPAFAYHGLLVTLLSFYPLAVISFVMSLCLFARSYSLGYSRLENLHRMLSEERQEIEENREQEKIELKALYELKGFSEPLLTQVCDTLMADSDRLLKVMLEEELGLSLAVYDHPLKLGIFAFLGSCLSALLVFVSCFFAGTYFFYLSSLILAIAGFLQAKSYNNDKLLGFIAHASFSVAIFIITKELLSLFPALFNV